MSFSNPAANALSRGFTAGSSNSEISSLHSEKPRDVETPIIERVPDATALIKGKDEALQLLSGNRGPPIPFTVEEDARLLRKIDKHLMPIMFIIYFLQLMDKQTLAFSSVFGISRDTHLEGDEYSLLGSIVYIAQIVMQPLSAYLLIRMRLSLYVPLILGGFEASIQAAFMLTTQIWYRRREQGVRLAVWFSNNGWVNIFGSLVMYGLGHVHSKELHPYQLIFLVLGSITFVVGILSFWVFPDNPVRCKFLTKEEKIMTIERVRANQQGLESKQFKMRQLLEMVLDIKSWCWMLLMFLLSVPTGGVAAFGPLIIHGFGFDQLTVLLLLMPYGVVQLLSLSLGSWACNHFRLKSPIVLIALLPCITASAILLSVGRTQKEKPILLAAYYLLASQNILTPTIMNWHTANVAGHTKKATSTSMMLTGYMIGSMTGPLLFTPKDQPYYRKGILALLICHCGAALLLVITVAYLSYLNEKKRRHRIARGKEGKIIDYSLMTTAEIENMRNEGIDVATGKQAFEDLTDLQNDEFVVRDFFIALNSFLIA
ncbi:allantoate permease [Crepidotus variabilis]|uniref:Allantoate permease n=1 Tax=Crepidotus variabilis TaxID=179855 RepID=A0A9P6JIN6_9AGAR|nr:allantoate permease [Crepidotus variabilis]